MNTSSKFKKLIQGLQKTSGSKWMICEPQPSSQIKNCHVLRFWYEFTFPHSTNNVRLWLLFTEAVSCNSHLTMANGLKVHTETGSQWKQAVMACGSGLRWNNQSHGGILIMWHGVHSLQIIKKTLVLWVGARGSDLGVIVRPKGEAHHLKMADQRVIVILMCE